MFTRRWTRWCAWVGAALVVALLISHRLYMGMVPRDSISLGNYKEIRLGMTKHEVIAIIGLRI
jgi:hypothetical protein